MLPASRIDRIGETPHAHERDGLKVIEEVLPDTDPFHVWERFHLLDPWNPASTQHGIGLCKVRDARARAPKAGTRKLVMQAVQYLLDHGEHAPGDAFAPAMGYLPFRVRGLVSNLQEVLNVDGYAVLEFDSVSNQVRLDREKLEQQFEVKL